MTTVALGITRVAAHGEVRTGTATHIIAASLPCAHEINFTDAAVGGLYLRRKKCCDLGLWIIRDRRQCRTDEEAKPHQKPPHRKPPKLLDCSAARLIRWTDPVVILGVLKTSRDRLIHFFHAIATFVGWQLLAGARRIVFHGAALAQVLSVGCNRLERERANNKHKLDFHIAFSM